MKNVQTSSAELAQVMGQLTALVAEQRQDLAGLTQSLRRSAQGIERAAPGPRLQGIMGRVDVLSARLERMADSLARSADSAQAILGRLENGQGVLGRLTREDALYVNANQAVVNIGRAASEMAQLAQDVRQNPKKYVKLSLF